MNKEGQHVMEKCLKNDIHVSLYYSVICRKISVSNIVYAILYI